MTAAGHHPGPTTVGAAINCATHPAIDRGAPFLWLAVKTGRRGFVEHCQAVRLDDAYAALHRIIGGGAVQGRATRYDKRGCIYLGTVTAAALLIWLGS
ncbi:hypothetical protein ACIOZL_30755 [Streptomyces sp. NPDC087769]|uniref:hypothetical protein n=1 Tax=Streptomyces sp. NPDC087769 TaxID=3365802 RepID=UPI0038290EB1